MPFVPIIPLQNLITYIDNNIRANGLELITGPIHNTVENNLVYYIKLATLNYELIDVVSSGGDISLVNNITAIITQTPTSLTWGDNFGNEWYIVNMRPDIIPLAVGTFYYDVTGSAVSQIAAFSTLHIGKAENGLWLQLDLGAGGSVSVLPPLIGIADGGGSDDPVSGISTFQNNKLIGLGTTNSSKIQIFINDISQSNFGQNSTFTFDGTTGTIDISPNIWIPGDGLYIDLNQ